APSRVPPRDRTPGPFPSGGCGSCGTGARGAGGRGYAWRHSSQPIRRGEELLNLLQRIDIPSTKRYKYLVLQCMGETDGPKPKSRFHERRARVAGVAVAQGTRDVRL